MQRTIKHQFGLCALAVFLGVAGNARAEVDTIYWSKVTSTSRTIWKSTVDGGATTGIASTTLGTPEDIALDIEDNMVYWIAFATNGQDRIERCSMDGAGEPPEVETILIGLFGSGHGITLDLVNDKIYWCVSGSPGGIYRCNLDGTGVETVVTDLYVPDHIVLDTENEVLYWTDAGGPMFGPYSKIQRANFDGSGVTDLAVEDGVGGPVWDPEGLAIDFDSGVMYWTQGGAAPAIRRAPLGIELESDDVETIVSSADGLVAPRDLALDLDAGKVYWTEAWHDAIQRANLDGSDIEDVVSSTVNCVGIALVSGGDEPVVGDVNGDDVVDVFDVLFLLEHWGSCDLPCPPTCAGDLNEDCALDVFDVLTVLGNWT